MRKNRRTLRNNYRILALDDDPIMTSTLQAYFQRSGYEVDVVNNPLEAVELVRNGHYDILLLDFLMTPICGDQVVEEIRKFNRDLYIILLTGHKSMAPPIRTIRELDIQGYYEKSDRFDQLELLVESCVKSIAQMRVIRDYQNGLAHMLDLMPQIYSLENDRSVLKSVLGIVNGIFRARSCFLFALGEMWGDDKDRLQIVGNLDPDRIRILVEQTDFSGGLVTESGPMLLGLIRDGDGNKEGILGVEPEEPADNPRSPENVQVQMMEICIRQIGTSMRNMQLHRLVRRKNEELTRANEQLNEGYAEIVNAMRSIVDERDIYTRGHSDRVSGLARAVAGQMDRDEEFVNRTGLCGLFHDIGKVGIPDEILLKPGRLTAEEYEVIKKHSEKGAKILSALSIFHEAVPIVRAHHERVDGRGYPDGLKGEQIPEEARIIAVADAFDAMTSNRHYRGSLSLETALGELEKGKGTQFDAAVVDGLMQLYRSCPMEEFVRKYMAAMPSEREEQV